jgi:hypothetical protein
MTQPVPETKRCKCPLDHLKHKPHKCPNAATTTAGVATPPSVDIKQVAVCDACSKAIADA